MNNLLIYTCLLISFISKGNEKIAKSDSLASKELVRILALSNLALKDVFTIEETRLYDGIPCAFKATISKKDHQQLLFKVKTYSYVIKEEDGYSFKTFIPAEGTIYINENENWMIVKGCPPNGTSELLAILKQENLSLVDDFFIEGLGANNGNYCSFKVQVSETDRKNLIEQLKKKPNFNEDSLKIKSLNGTKISVAKSELYLEIDACLEVQNVDYPIEDESWLDKVTIPDNVKYFEPRPNPDQLKDEAYIGTVFDSTNFIINPFDFVLINGSQPGIYSYELGLSKTEKGAVFLRAFELTTNHRLSADRVLFDSILEVENESQTLKKLKSDGNFLIQEGKNHIPYLARFEVWFYIEGKDAIKIAEKIYKIEGWER